MLVGFAVVNVGTVYVNASQVRTVREHQGRTRIDFDGRLTQSDNRVFVDVPLDQVVEKLNAALSSLQVI